MKLKMLPLMAIVTSAGIIMGCSSGSSSGVGELNSLGSIPDASSFVASASASSSSFSFAATSGTAPLLATFVSAAVADDVFWNGLVEAVTANTAGELSYDGETYDLDDSTDWQFIQSAFFGQSEGGPGGSGACQMAASVGEAMRRIVSNTVCYIKEMADSSEVPVSPEVSDRSVIFAQEAADKVVQVNVSNDEFSEEEGGSMAVNITVVGSDNLSGNIYKLELVICAGSDVQEYEEIIVNRDTGEFSSSAYRNEGSGSSASSILAFLTVDEDGSISFDTTRARTGISNWSGTFGDQTHRHKSFVSIDGSTMTIKGYSSGDFGVGKNYSLASYTGSNAATLRFTEGAYKGIHSPNTDFCTGCEEHEYSGQAEYRDDNDDGEGYYQATTSGTFNDEIAAYELSSDDFFASFDEPDVSVLATKNCSVTPAYTIEMDFSLPAVEAVQTICDDRGLEGDFNRLCWSEEVNEAQQELFSHGSF